MRANSSRPDDQIKAVFVAGATSGFVNSIISGPLELAKIQLQNQTLSQPKFRGPLHCLCWILKNRGITTAYRGIGATILRETPSYGIYFACFELLRRKFSPIRNDSESVSEESGLGLMMAGGLSGIAGWMSTYPADVAKTKIQAQCLELPRKELQYRTTWSTLRLVYKAEGTAGLFRGTFATILRAFPTNAALFLVYAITMRSLEAENPFLQ